MKEQGGFARYGSVLVVAGALALAGCAGSPPAPVVDRSGQAQSAVVVPAVPKDAYIVKKGDTLYSIALDHGLDYRDLAAWNNLDNPNLILVGQALRVKAPGSPASGDTPVVRPIAGGSAPEPRPLGSSSDTLKREPKAGKEPYSEQALARARQKEAEPVAIAAAPVVKTETTAESKPPARSEAKPEAKPDSKPEARAEAASQSKAGDAAGNEEISWSWPASGKLIGGFSESGNKGIDIGGKAGDPVIAAAGGKVVYSGTGLRGYGKLVIIKHNNTFLTAYAHNQNILVKEGQNVAKGQKIAEMGSTDTDQVKLHFEVRQQGKPVDPIKHLPPR
jgi:lipoprotein NlpD